MTGRPANLDDCLDFIETRRPSRACLELHTMQMVREWFRVTQYAGCLRMAVRDREVLCRLVFGGYVASRPEPSRSAASAAMEEAERGVKRLLDLLTDRGIAVTCPSPGFRSALPAADASDPLISACA